MWRFLEALLFALAGSPSDSRCTPMQYAARAMCSSAASTPIYGACILERSPVIVPDEPAWENEYLTWREQLQQRYYKEYPPQFLAGKGAQQDEAEQDTRTQFQPAPRITEADHNNDRKSLWRKLDQRLYLLVKERGAGSWRFPQQQHREGESIRQTIERAIGQRALVIPGKVALESLAPPH
ncbi:hypothetical protein WJX72_011878 [[Myrmecia] bisecta]|uniref:Large ribosomal subunit protein mL46 N-terminal domain-containing protein n=1 Tax=[Myrmecia] bisecta TaxID=41462 RepID=A0AAW1P3X7_9CHLO